MKNKILDVADLNAVIEEERKKGKRIVSTSGCFDILHAGHVTYLEEAKEKGDVLVLLLNSDVSVRKLKGINRPVISQEERAVVVAGLGCVDYVCMFDDLTPCGIISLIRPDIVVKGGDYREKHIPEMEVLAEYGGCVEYVSLVEGCSSTGIMEKIGALR